MSLLVHFDAQPQVAFVRDLTLILTESSHQTLLFYSGGSGLQPFSMLFESLVAAQYDFSQLMLAPVDERFTILNSNFNAFKGTSVFEQFSRAGAHFVDTALQGGTLEEASKWYNQWVSGEIRRMQMVKGKVVTLLGMGPDGHTAGIFPFPEDREFFLKTFVETDLFVAGYDVGDKNPYRERFTLTVPALQQSDAVLAYVTGENKREMLEEVLEKNRDTHLIPARIWHMLPSVSLYTDQNIAS
jgi:6-phosphogluconolactonase